MIYATRGCWHNPTRDRAQVVAVGSVASPVSHTSVDVAGETMPQHCDLALDVVLAERGGIPFTDLVGRLSVTKGRDNWGPVLRRTIVALADRDIVTVRRAVDKAARTRS